MDFSGNSVPGVPEHFVNGAIEYRHSTGLHGAFEVRYAGPFFADDANTVETESYVVADLRFGWEGRFGRWRVVPHIGFNNLFDAKYIDNIRLNGSFGRYFEPAPEFEAYGGLSLGYEFGGP
jgi:iron complex outermembrane receptor protein